jgi:hypothetical protein
LYFVAIQPTGGNQPILDQASQGGACSRYKHVIAFLAWPRPGCVEMRRPGLINPSVYAFNTSFVKLQGEMQQT